MNIATLKQYDKICLVDVGFHKGHFVNDFIRDHGFDRSKMRVIAIDPIKHNQGSYDEFHQVAISTEPGRAKFNIYDEPGCNSLHDLQTGKMVDKINHEGWYCRYPIKKIDEIEVDVVRLDTILETLQEPIIHFLKVDA
jgi:hypothetical protein